MVAVRCAGESTLFSPLRPRRFLLPLVQWVPSNSEVPEMEATSAIGPSVKALGRKEIFAYGVGHMLNDLTAACWFTYLLIYLTDAGLSPREAAVVMLSGQIADGVSTVSIGYLIDLFGRFKVWHAAGSLLVAVSFSSVFGGCSVCALTGSHTLFTRTLGYSTFAAIFNIGWAATQVSHMSLVNCITADATSRVALNSCRNAFTMVASLFLYGISYVIFAVKNTNAVQEQFTWISVITIFLGACFVIVFFFGVTEPRLEHHAQIKISSGSWFGRILYYQVAVVYTLTRLTVNVSQVLLAFYLIDDLAMDNSSKAVVPAIIYISSFATSIWLQELHWSSSKLKTFFTGGALSWACCGIAILYLSQGWCVSIYPLAVLIGLANAFMLVTATSMEALLVGHNLSGCGFVYGSLSLMDKLTCGVALYLIESFHKKSSPALTLENRDGSFSLVRLVLALVPGGCSLLGALISWTMNFDDVATSCLTVTLLSQNEQQQVIEILAGEAAPEEEQEQPVEGKRGRWGPSRDSKPTWLS